VTGKTKVMITEETIREALAEHFSNKVLREGVACLEVNYEYANNQRFWYCVIEQVQPKVEVANDAPAN